MATALEPHCGRFFSGQTCQTELPFFNRPAHKTSQNPPTRSLRIYIHLIVPLTLVAWHLGISGTAWGDGCSTGGFQLDVTSTVWNICLSVLVSLCLRKDWIRTFRNARPSFVNHLATAWRCTGAPILLQLSLW